MTDTLDKTYDPSAIETRWYAFWESQGHFAPSGEGTPYSIMIPPPNVTGSLHMGHAFQDTIMDAMIRYHRMLGHDTLWQVGTDHAGIATQMLVERQLLASNISRHDLGREKFLDKVWGMEAHVRRHDHPTVTPDGCLFGLVTRALHHGRGLLSGGPGSLYSAV